jgi:hypothetical protein
MRHHGFLGANKAASEFDPDNPELQKISSCILDRVAKIDAREVRRTELQIRRLVKEWARWAEQFDDLVYWSPHTAKHVLLRNAGDGHTMGWETLQSMRNVDRACAIRVL